MDARPSELGYHVYHPGRGILKSESTTHSSTCSGLTNRPVPSKWGQLATVQSEAGKLKPISTHKGARPLLGTFWGFPLPKAQPEPGAGLRESWECVETYDDVLGPVLTCA